MSEKFTEFEDELMLLLQKHFGDEHRAVSAAALAVALGDIIGMADVTLATALETTTQTMVKAAFAMRKMKEEVMTKIAPGSETRQ